MTRSSLRTLIVVLTLVTAAVHLVVLNLGFLSGDEPLDVLFALNGLGYLALLGAFLFNIPAGQERLVHYAFMAFAAVTIIAWVFLNFMRGFGDALGYITKLDEVLLIVFLWMHLQRSE